jgi:hypothetical protein
LRHVPRESARKASAGCGDTERESTVGWASQRTSIRFAPVRCRAIRDGTRRAGRTARPRLRPVHDGSLDADGPEHAGRILLHELRDADGALQHGGGAVRVVGGDASDVPQVYLTPHAAQEGATVARPLHTLSSPAQTLPPPVVACRCPPFQCSASGTHTTLPPDSRSSDSSTGSRSVDLLARVEIGRKRHTSAWHKSSDLSPSHRPSRWIG